MSRPPRRVSNPVEETQHPHNPARLLAAIVESSNDAIVSKDLNSNVTSWNKAAERMFGYTSEEIVGRPITLIIPAELQSEETHILAKIRNGELIDHFETVRLTKGGERLDVSLTISPIKDQNGQIIGAAKIARDITHQKKLEAALRTTEKLASVGRLAASVAHEINNPLETVTNVIYLANRQPELSDKTRRLLKQADQELRRVAHITRQTLGFYRDSTQPKSLLVAKVIDDVLTVYEGKSRYKDLKIERRIESGLAIYTQEGELKQVLSNLLANAIDACRDEGRIVISARAWLHPQTGTGIRVTVADNGIGIPDRDKAKVFAPFYTTKDNVGTGLGLWITKELLKKKGGHIRLRSSSERKRSGTVISIFLPCQSATPPPGEHTASNG